MSLRKNRGCTIKHHYNCPWNPALRPHGARERGSTLQKGMETGAFLRSLSHWQGGHSLCQENTEALRPKRYFVFLTSYPKGHSSKRQGVTRGTKQCQGLYTSTLGFAEYQAISMNFLSSPLWLIDFLACIRGQGAAQGQRMDFTRGQSLIPSTKKGKERKTAWQS